MIDDIIFKLSNLGIDNLNGAIPSRDKKVLKNMAKLMVDEDYITESQANLIIKILEENLKNLDDIGIDLVDAIKNPVWRKPFKNLEIIKKVGIFHDSDHGSMIDIMFSYEKDLAKYLKNLQRKLNCSSVINEGKHTFLPLVEKNIIDVYEALSPLNFEFSDNFLELVEKIKNLDIDIISKKFNFENFPKNKITEDLSENNLLILDRKIRYQYQFDQEFDKNIKAVLAYKIANRNQINVFLKYNEVGLIDILNNLALLKREKILFIFNEYAPLECVDQLINLKNSLDESSKNNVGIYFRFDNKKSGFEFNKLIAENSFNKKLDKNTKIVGISNGKVPKFMIDNEWQPDAVISFTNSFRNNRSVVYCNSCDLIVYYTPTKPISIKLDDIM